MSINILQFTDSFDQGGSEGQALQLVKLLSEAGSYNMFLATLDGTGVLRPDFEKLNVSDIREFPLTSFYDLNFLRQVKKCVRFIVENKIELVHSHGFYSNIFGMFSALLARVPIRIASRRETTGIRTSTQQRVERIAYRIADVIIANSRAVQDQLIKEGVPARKIKVIYNGIDTARFIKPGDGNKAEFFDRFGLPFSEDIQVISIVANFRLEVKDYPTFLRAARLVLDAKPHSKFFLAGEGPLIENMSQFAGSLGLGESVFFMGRLEAVEELLAISDVCVLSSRAEGFSNSILEYMAAGNPVVVTDVGGARETVEDGKSGYIIPPGDEKTMAERIISLLSQPDRARAMGELGRTVVDERFSLTERLSKTIGLYESVLESTQGQINAPHSTPLENDKKEF